MQKWAFWKNYMSIHPQSNAIVNEERPCHSLLSIIGRIIRRVGSVRSAPLHIQSNRIISTPNQTRICDSGY
jgi:hypothetical protein